MCAKTLKFTDVWSSYNIKHCLYCLLLNPKENCSLLKENRKCFQMLFK